MDPLLIVGMHRSGTSFLAGSLEECGLRLGPVSTSNPFNLKGSRENPVVTRFHEGILQARGGSWFSPPTGPIVWTSDEEERALALFEGRDPSKPWGFKDPRAILMIECWQKIYREKRAVGIFRHPGNVARSLAVRNKMLRNDAILLWMHYNSRLLELHYRDECPLINFDSPIHSLQARIDHVAVSLALKPPSGPRFFSAELKHHVESDEELPEKARELYATLVAASGL